MLKFNELSMSQKKAVVAIVQHTPALKKTGRVTLKEIIAVTQDLASKRSQGAPKIGYPNWLFKENKVERGIYQLPVPTDEEVKEFNAAISAPKVKKAKVGATKKVVAKKVATTDTELEKSRLQNIIDESEVAEEFTSDQEFLDELRANGINV